MASWGQSSTVWNDAEAKKLPEKVEQMNDDGEMPNGANGINGTKRKRVVVVGLGMVGIAFM